jgi:predicted MFS family arabinose efflux permease
LLFARIVTGLFGGVIGSISFAITTDLFSMEKRGRVMGLMQTAFAASQILGLPAGLYLSNKWDWHAPFLMIVGLSLIVGILIFTYLKPIDGHLKIQTDRSPLRHMTTTVRNPRYLFAFGATALLSIGGFMMMPFGSAFTVHNLMIPVENLPMIYGITGVCSIIIGPLVGRAADRFGKFPVFIFGSFVSIVMVIFYTHMGPSSLPLVIVVNAVMFIGIFSRMIPSQALMSGIPDPSSRGAFMSISSSLQQIAGGFASILAGAIVVQTQSGALEHFDTLGFVMVGTTVFSFIMMYFINRMVNRETTRPDRTKVEK